MTIQANEIKWYKPAVINDTDGNGGAMSANKCLDGVKNNVWPDVSQEERKAGSVKYRKTFIKVENPDDLALLKPQIFVESATPGDNSIVILLGTQTDTQSDVVGYSRFYGAASLDKRTFKDDKFIQVKVEPGNGADGHNIFQAGDLVRISDMENVNAPDGNGEFVRLDRVTWNGLFARLHLPEGVQLEHVYSTADKVSSVIESQEIRATVEEISQHTQEGEFTCAVGTNNIGAVEQIWTISFTSSTEFCCHGNTLGLVGTGTIDYEFAPSNPHFHMPYFWIGADGWGGPYWGIGESVTFTTHPASVAVWEKRTVSAGCSYVENKVVVAITGESE